MLKIYTFLQIWKNKYLTSKNYFPFYWYRKSLFSKQCKRSENPFVVADGLINPYNLWMLSKKYSFSYVNQISYHLVWSFCLTKNQSTLLDKLQNLSYLSTTSPEWLVASACMWALLLWLFLQIQPHAQFSWVSENKQAFLFSKSK